jgi:hypothetical protein
MYGKKFVDTATRAHYLCARATHLFCSVGTPFESFVETIEKAMPRATRGGERACRKSGGRQKGLCKKSQTSGDLTLETRY